ncbi:MAG: DUF6916 family protein [Pyrinomonadaceae bacterium]
MPEKLTEEDFARQLNSKFRVRAATPRPLELELVEVKSWRSGAAEQSGMERFSLFFTGPADIFLPQQSYTLEHEQLGVLDIFLVPVARTAEEMRYEAVFNFYR